MQNIYFLNNNNKNQTKVDILLVTGDMFIDHPSFGIAIIARVLENAGYSVCIVSQPDYLDPDFLKQLPEPQLFIGITAGNLDSIVNNYTSNRNQRKKDDYSIDGNPFFPNGKRKRPDRATIVYTSYLKQRFKNIPVVIGGIEASLRRFVHYDFIQQKLRKSILIDAKADILVYSMGEKSILAIADRLKNKQPLINIKGTCIKISQNEKDKFIFQKNNFQKLPSIEEITSDKAQLITATQMIEANMIPQHAKNLYQEQGNFIVLSYKPQDPLSQTELDQLYALPFQKNMPEYCQQIPAWNMIKTSITSHRGCFGRCSFCAIASHQGPIISTRSQDSIVTEANKLLNKTFFKGTITDIGGPTANMYGTTCKIGWCKDPHCLFPEICPNLEIDKYIYQNLLNKVKNTKGVKNVFVSSGIRHDLALEKTEETAWIIKNATSGHFKIAPEHIDNKVLRLMKKPDRIIFEKFIQFFNTVNKKNQLNFFILPYIILSHPGSTIDSVRNLGKFLKQHRISIQQYQDFTPTPQTLSTAMFFAKKSPDNKDIAIYNLSSLHNKQREILKKYLK